MELLALAKRNVLCLMRPLEAQCYMEIQGCSMQTALPAFWHL